MRSCIVYFNGIKCGMLQELDDCYEFQYDKKYLAMKGCQPISLTMPLTDKVYTSPHLFSFFDGLIPEGYLLELFLDKYELKPTDRFELLIKSGANTIGAVTVQEKENE